MKIAIDERIQLGVDCFSSAGEVCTVSAQELTPGRLKGFDVLVVRSVTLVDEELLTGTRVRFVGSVTSGVDHINLDYLREAGIGFAHAPGSNANSVAEYVVAALLYLHARERVDLHKATLGVIGVGQVGSRVVEKARALGLSVVMNDPPLASRGHRQDLALLPDVLECDIVTLHVPLTRVGDDATFHLLNRERLSQMKPGSVLINTARGDVVDPDALLSSVKIGCLAAFALDVWPGEPFVSRDLISAAALATPHIAGHSQQGKTRGTEVVYEALCSFFEISATWKAPELPTHSAKLTPIASDTFTSLNEAVRKAYDIEADNNALKRKGSHFETLRANHANHTEFHHIRVGLAPDTHPARPALEMLGFHLAPPTAAATRIE